MDRAVFGTAAFLFRRVSPTLPNGSGTLRAVVKTMFLTSVAPRSTFSYIGEETFIVIPYVLKVAPTHQQTPPEAKDFFLTGESIGTEELHNGSIWVGTRHDDRITVLAFVLRRYTL